MKASISTLRILFPSHLMVPVGEGKGLMRWVMLSGMLMVSGEICGWTGLTGDSGTFLRSFLSVDRAVNVIFILVLGKRKQHLGGKDQKREHKVCFSESCKMLTMLDKSNYVL